MKLLVPLGVLILTASAVGGITMGNHAVNKLDVESGQSGDLLTSKLVGATVYDTKQDTIGKIEDLVIVEGKAVSGVIVSVGGFLGIGDSYVLVNPSSFAVSIPGQRLESLPRRHEGAASERSEVHIQEELKPSPSDFWRTGWRLPSWRLMA